ncbi:MAG: hypothetical protein P8J37_18775 [Fuerstiella sp.]|nr:hypothetical protein [Fuerstiella sp.]
MTQHQRDEERIFHVARGLDNSELRQEYLNQICEGDQGLRERVDALLAVHEKERTFLKSQAEKESTVLYSGITETVAQKIGRYKLLQKIGEGGFGVVYMAEQSRPVRRKVALKVIKPSDSLWH